ncbi:Uncharacterized protein FWK35_00012946 [Aphis craccivora]|uniref:DUF5641 domain-containing protein n=1 Tax=Aphis craccivora TaxID=307492 RepID=A0A6G0YFK0_APHCR|nr:Uncharacterized protein FWK35_00012946 [Aphis craccivora]
MVVLKDNTLPPLTWRLGRILEVMPNKDGVVRVVWVLTKGGPLIRPVVKLVLLPTDQLYAHWVQLIGCLMRIDLLLTPKTDFTSYLVIMLFTLLFHSCLFV